MTTSDPSTSEAASLLSGDDKSIQASIQHSQQLHRSSADSHGPFTALFLKDKNQAHEAIQNYFQFYQSTQGDVDKKVDEEATQHRMAAYSQVTDTYYDLTTDMFEWLWGKSIHFAPLYQGEPFKQSIVRHEHYLALLLEAKPGMHLLDVGCGIGEPAREMMRFCGVHITGLNNNAYQLERARHYNSRSGLSDRWTSVKGDFMKMPIPANSMDGAYAIEATCYAPDLASVYRQVFQVLRPGAHFACYEMCLTDAYDATNAEHYRIRRSIEKFLGMPKLVERAEVLHAMQAAGFEVFYNEVLGLDAAVPWYTPFKGNWGTNIAFSKLGMYCLSKFVNFCITLGVAPKSSDNLVALILESLPDFVAGGELGIFTPMYCLAARKPSTLQ